MLRYQPPGRRINKEQNYPPYTIYKPYISFSSTFHFYFLGKCFQRAEFSIAVVLILSFVLQSFPLSRSRRNFPFRHSCSLCSSSSSIVLSRPFSQLARHKSQYLSPTDLFGGHCDVLWFRSWKLRRADWPLWKTRAAGRAAAAESLSIWRKWASILKH